MFLSYLCLVLSIVSHIYAAHLPDGVKACKNDKNLNECSKKNGQEAIKTIVKGLPKYGVPVMDPLFFEELRVSESTNKNIQLNLKFNKFQMTGLKDTVITKSIMDTKTMHVSWDFHIPKLTFVGNYSLTGKVLVVPLNGKGKGTVILDDFDANYSFDYKLTKRKGMDYIEVQGKPKISYKVSNLKIIFDSLFGNDKTLSDTTNQMLNDNWRDLNDALGPAIAEGIAEVFTNLLKSLTKLVPFNELFLK